MVNSLFKGMTCELECLETTKIVSILWISIKVNSSEETLKDQTESQRTSRDLILPDGANA